MNGTIFEELDRLSKFEKAYPDKDLHFSDTLGKEYEDMTPLEIAYKKGVILTTIFLFREFLDGNSIDSLFQQWASDIVIKDKIKEILEV